MKILHLLKSNKFSGAEGVALMIMSLFPEDECIYASPDGPIREAVEARQQTFYPLKSSDYTGIKCAIDNIDPDIIHAHDMGASVLAAIAAPNSHIVSHIHNSDFKARKVSIKSLSYLLCSKRFSNIVWVSNSCFNGYVFHNELKQKSSILYNVVNQEEIRQKVKLDVNDYNYDVVYVGRIADPKNPLRLIRILNIIHNKKSDIRVAIIGTGDLLNAVKNEVKNYHIEDNVDFYGFMSNPFKILQSAKVMVMTSDREGTPMSALEAMALGVPIVSTSVDGLCELIDSGTTGYLQDNDSEFAESVLRLVLDVKTQKMFSKATLKRFQKMNNISKYGEEIRKIYESINLKE